MVDPYLAPLLAAAAACVIAWQLRRLVGTTLLAPASWLVAALVLIAIVELLIAARFASPHASACRFAAASLSICPGIALLGAKRPQSRSWQWIVLSLWIVLILPALQGLVSRNASSLEVHPARATFMAILALFGAVNCLAARHWPAVLLGGAGQAILLSPFLLPEFKLPQIATLDPDASAVLLATGLFLIAALSTLRPPSRRPHAHPLDRAWIDFRESFGLVWSLRFLERINAVAQANGWNVELRWSGFVTPQAESSITADEQRVLRQAMLNLLRRFVSSEWIAERIDTVGRESPADREIPVGPDSS